MKYVMLICGIVGMGGGQKYCSNKIDALKKLGYKTVVVSAFQGEVILENLKKFSEKIISEIRVSPCNYSYRQREKILNYLINIIGDTNADTIIDSSNVALSEWGELIAERLGCRHVCFFIDEEFNVQKEDIEFLKFKHSQKAIWGSSNRSLAILFKDYYKLDKSECYSFVPHCTNVVEDIPNIFISQYTLNAINIGVFGRLEKQYIINSIESIIPFFKKYSEKSFNLIVIGGSSDSYYSNIIKNSIRELKNVNLILTGFVNPVSRKLLKSLDVCISSAGCAILCTKEDIPTLYVNALNGNFVGVLNYTINIHEDHRYNQNNNESVIDALDKILMHDYCKIQPKLNPYLKVVSDEDLVLEVKRQLFSINAIKSYNKYFNINSIVYTSRKAKVIKLILQLFGIKFLDYCICKIWHRLKK